MSHAYQDAEGSRTNRGRQSIGEQVARLAPWSTFFLIAGFWFGVPLFIVLSLLFVGGLVLFALATLPVEIGASHRALGVVRQTGLADATEFREIRQVLRAAALTYVVGISTDLATSWCCCLSPKPGGASRLRRPIGTSRRTTGRGEFKSSWPHCGPLRSKRLPQRPFWVCSFPVAPDSAWTSATSTRPREPRSHSSRR